MCNSMKVSGQRLAQRLFVNEKLSLYRKISLIFPNPKPDR